MKEIKDHFNIKFRYIYFFFNCSCICNLPCIRFVLLAKKLNEQFILYGINNAIDVQIVTDQFINLIDISSTVK